MDKKLLELREKLINPATVSYLRETPDYVVIKDVEGRYCAASASFLRFIGKDSIDDIFGKVGREIFSCLDLADVYRKNDRYVLDNRIPYMVIDENLADCDGSICIESTRKYLITDEQGESIAIMDVSQKSELQNLISQNTVLGDLFQKSQTGMWFFRLDDDGVGRLYADGMICELLGIDRNLAPEKAYEAFLAGVDPSDREQVEDCIRQAVEEGIAETEYTWHFPDGRKVRIRTTGTRDHSCKDGIRIKGYSKNVTEYYERNNVVLARQLEVTKALAEGIDCIFRVNFEEDTYEVEQMSVLVESGLMTKRIMKDVGTCYSEAIRMYIDVRVAREDQERLREEMCIEHITERLKHEKGFYLQYRLNGRNTDREYYELHVVGLGSNQDGSCGLISFRCIDEQKQLEIEAQKAREEAVEASARANKIKADFLANMSHDIRTPMNGIMGLLDIEEHCLDDPEKLREYHKKIRVAADHLLSLLNDVLDMSRLENKGEVTYSEDPFDLEEVLDNCYTILEQQAAEHSISLVTHISETGRFDVTKFIGSALYLRQIMLNIVSNAIKYNRPGGKVDLWGRIIERTEDTVTFCFEFKDNGIGMDPELVEHAFEPFVQGDESARTQYQGTGLGLSIVKSMVDEMGGEIFLESEKGVGTVFAVILTFKVDKEQESRKEPEIQVEPIEPEDEGTLLEDVRILLVEDNELNMEIAHYILETYGAEVTEANNGSTAIEKFVDCGEGAFDVILMDIMMPIMDGLSATRAIRALPGYYPSNVPIIAMTANAFEEDKKNCLDAGMTAYLTKPVIPEHMVETILKFL